MASLPPLNTVKVFDVVARHLNFTKAAAELAMTQSAVSYQIKTLEAFVGAPLFVRLARGVALSKHGLALAPIVRHSIGELSRALQSARDQSESVLAITAVHTLATNWLAPRIGSFQLAHPELAVRLDVSGHIVDLHTEDVDAALRHGKGAWPGMVTHLLFESSFTPVCSPTFLAREGPFARPADLLGRTLVDPEDDWWAVWFEKAGVKPPVVIEPRGIQVGSQQMAASVAAAGHGIAIVTPGFVRDDLQAGRLVQLFDIIASTGSNYYLVYPEAHRATRKIRLFRDWLLAEVSRGS